MGTLAWLIGFLIAYTGSVVLHELAHALAAHWVELRVYEIRLGWGAPFKTWRIGDVDLQLCGYPASGSVVALPLRARGYRWKIFVMIAAGPFVSALLLVGFAAILLSEIPNNFPFRTAIHSFSTVMVPANAYICLVTLIPYSNRRGSKLIESDGLWLFKVFRMTDAQIEEQVTAGHVMRASRLMRRGNSAKAGRWLLRRLACDASARPEYLLWGATILGEREMKADAERLILRILRRSDDGRSMDDQCATIDSVATFVLGGPFGGLVQECLHRVEEMIKLFPERITLRGTRGGLLFELGNYEAAERDLAQCLEQSSAPHDRGISAAYLAALAHQRGDSAGVAKFNTIARESGAISPIIERLQKKLQEPARDSMVTS